MYVFSVGEGARLVARPLTRPTTGTPPLRLALITAAATLPADGVGASVSGAGVAAWLDGLKVGDWVDAQDKGHSWRVAKVTAIAPDGSTLDVAYKVGGADCAAIGDNGG